jgi:hypothetical protein
MTVHGHAPEGSGSQKSGAFVFYFTPRIGFTPPLKGAEVTPGAALRS